MKVLVVGGSRFLGLNIVQRLSARGDEVIVANRGQTETELPAGVQHLQVDLTQPGALADAVKDMTSDAAVHMIAMSAPRAEVVLEALEGKMGHYVQCGSVGVYAPLHCVPADESHPTNPRQIGPDSEYVGFSHKLAADQVAERLCADWNVPLTILRPSAIIGAGDVPIDLWGARNPKCFQRIIDGEVISLPNDGRALIQFGHVGDLADAFVLALDQPDRPGIYNITSDYAITLNYYTQILGEYLEREPVIEYVPMEQLIAMHAESGKLNESGLRFLCEHMCYTITKARETLGFDPQYTAEKAVAESVEWMLSEGLIARR